MNDLDSLLEPFGFVSPVREEVETFHESTKIFPARARRFKMETLEYVSSVRGVLEISRNRRRYPLAERVALPDVAASATSLADCLTARHSTRTFRHGDLDITELSQVLGCAKVRRHTTLDAGSELKVGLRAYPSAGGLYPIETYVALRRVRGLPSCIAHYDPYAHELEIVRSPLDLTALANALGGEGVSIPDVPAVIFASALFERTTVKYRERGYRFALLEAGMLTYLYSLGATAIDLDTLHWGGFLDDEVNDLMGLDGVGETAVECLFLGPSPS